MMLSAYVGGVETGREEQGRKKGGGLGRLPSLFPAFALFPLPLISPPPFPPTTQGNIMSYVTSENSLCIAAPSSPIFSKGRERLFKY